MAQGSEVGGFTGHTEVCVGWEGCHRELGLIESAGISQTEGGWKAFQVERLA